MVLRKLVSPGVLHKAVSNMVSSISYRWAKCIREGYCSYCGPKKLSNNLSTLSSIFHRWPSRSRRWPTFPSQNRLLSAAPMDSRARASPLPRLTSSARQPLPLLRAPPCRAPLFLPIPRCFFSAPACSSLHDVDPFEVLGIVPRHHVAHTIRRGSDVREPRPWGAQFFWAPLIPIFSAASGWEQQQFPSLPWLQSVGVPRLWHGVLPPNAAPAASAPLFGMYSGEIQIARSKFFFVFLIIRPTQNVHVSSDAICE